MAFDINKFAATAPQPASESDAMLKLPVDQIRDNPRNFYPRPDGAALTALRESIEANGLLEPPTVVPAGEGIYRLISGHSRMTAIRQLRNQAHCRTRMTSRWDTVLCRVLEPMDPATELTAVIEANRQRVKSPALLATEAEQLAEAYTRRQEAGEKLPDTVRSMVAEALQINRTKVSNLKTIREGIKVPGIRERWERDELPEAAALIIAKMDINTQYRLLDWVIDHGKSWSISDVKLFASIWSCCEHRCPETAGLCPHAETIIHDKLRGGAFNCGGCCKKCLSAGTCSTCCDYVRAQRAATDGGTPAAEPEAAFPMPTEPPEGQLVIAGWMPGGTTPAEPGEFAVLVDLGHSLYHKFFIWDGAAWKLPSSGAKAELEPVWWLRLPPVPEKGA